jgi:restriction endonuclease S subunit
MIISEIRYNQVIEKLRFDAEFYKPEFLSIEIKLNNAKSISLNKIAKFSKLRRNPENEPNKKFQYIDISNVNIFTGCIDAQILKGHEAPSRARKVVRENDIILSTVRPNRNAVAIILKELDNQICSTGFAVLKSEKVNPWFLFTYLKTKYGIKQLVRMTMASMYPAVSEDDVASILVPVTPFPFQPKIESYVKESYNKRKLADEKYKQAQELLNKILGIEKLELKEEKIFETGFDEFENSQRFDTDYYLPKYAEIFKVLKKSKLELKKLKELCKETVRRINPLDKPAEKFTYVEIGDVDVSTGEIKTKSILGHEAPPNARRLLKGGNLVISMVRPTRGAITIIPEELDNSLGSTAFYILEISSPLREFLFLYLRSDIGLNQLGRPVVGAMYPTLKKEYIEEIIIPSIPEKNQKQISDLIKQSFLLRKESKKLIEQAKKEIEEFIEKENQNRQ